MLFSCTNVLFAVTRIIYFNTFFLLACVSSTIRLRGPGQWRGWFYRGRSDYRGELDRFRLDDGTSRTNGPNWYVTSKLCRIGQNISCTKRWPNTTGTGQLVARLGVGIRRNGRKNNDAEFCDYNITNLIVFLSSVKRKKKWANLNYFTTNLRYNSGKNCG